MVGWNIPQSTCTHPIACHLPPRALLHGKQSIPAHTRAVAQPSPLTTCLPVRNPSSVPSVNPPPPLQPYHPPLNSFLLQASHTFHVTRLARQPLTLTLTRHPHCLPFTLSAPPTAYPGLLPSEMCTEVWRVTTDGGGVVVVDDQLDPSIATAAAALQAGRMTARSQEMAAARMPGAAASSGASKSSGSGLA